MTGDELKEITSFSVDVTTNGRFEFADFVASGFLVSANFKVVSGRISVAVAKEVSALGITLEACSFPLLEFLIIRMALPA